jgi:hypothetical protein
MQECNLEETPEEILAVACSDENLNMPLMKRPRRKKN